VKKTFLFVCFQILGLTLWSQENSDFKGVYFEVDYASNMLWLVTNFEDSDCLDLAFAQSGADSALPIVCKSYVEKEFLIYHVDIPLIQLQGEGEILQLCPQKKNFQKIFEYYFKNGRFIVKSKLRETPKTFDFNKIREQIAKLNKKGEELKAEKKKKSKAADWVIASLITALVGGIWSLLLFSA
jgi:hypothetical protein